MLGRSTPDRAYDADSSTMDGDRGLRPPRLAKGRDFDRLVAALVRTELANDYENIREAARS